MDLVDPRWRARAQSVYAGRTFATEDIAATDQNLRGRMIAVSDEFTSALVAYSAMYGRLMASLDYAKSRTREDKKAIEKGMRRSFDEAIADYKRGGLLTLKGNFLMTFSSENDLTAFKVLCGAAEQWTLAHELAHHLARDLSVRRYKGVASALRTFTSQSCVWTALTSLSIDQRCEVEADLLATLIIARQFTDAGPTPARLHIAVGGAAIALVAVAHLRNEWVNGPDESHPGCLLRLRMLLMMISETYGTYAMYPDDPARAHVTVSRAAASLMTLAHFAGGRHEVAGFGGQPTNAREMRLFSGFSGACSDLLVVYGG
ncbi:MAG: hypothetical protein M3R63_13515 [Actinomycetota bacterium]|nr:hypothetical protein [Actinomycetota bacterium]